MNETPNNASVLNMLDKKRKRDIKNNKLVFILGDSKKDRKEKDIKTQSNTLRRIKTLLNEIK